MKREKNYILGRIFKSSYFLKMMSYEGFFPTFERRKQKVVPTLFIFWPFMVSFSGQQAKSNASFRADTVCILSDISLEKL